MKVTSILTACFILIFGLVTSVGAISYTDARFDTEIEYSLILNSVTDFTYNFTFTIAPTGGGTGTWYADWFAIKFDGRDGTIGTPTLGSWEYWDKNNDEKLWGGKNYTVGRPEGGFIGF